jgi:hypothetical protein
LNTIDGSQGRFENISYPEWSLCVCRGILTVKDLIESFMGDLLIPVVNHFLFQLHLKHFSKYLPGNDKVNGRRLTQEFLTFVTTFIILYLLFVNLIP